MAGRTQKFDTRQSMNSRRFEIFHYRDQQPHNINIHHHDFYEIYFFMGGNVEFRVEGKTYRLEPGDLILISPQEFHQAEIKSDVLYERFVLWIDRSYLSTLNTDDFSMTACFDFQAPVHTNLYRPDKLRRAMLRELLDKLTGEFYSSRKGCRLYAQGLFQQFMVEVNRLVSSNVRPDLSLPEPDLVSQVLAYIGGHFEEALTLEQLAAEFFVSKYYLSHEFRQQVGTSVYHYIICKRLLRAKEQMEQGSPPGTVYQSCGFGDYANFYRAFRGEYGISPKAFFSSVRKEH